MTEKDIAGFDRILSRMFRVMGKSHPDAEAKRVWWDLFAKVELSDFAEACTEYMRHEERFPVPAGVRKYVRRQIVSQQLVTSQQPPRARNSKRAVELLQNCKKRLEAGKLDG